MVSKSIILLKTEHFTIIIDLLSNVYSCLYIIMLCYRSYREQMAKEMADFVSRLVRCDLGKQVLVTSKSYFKITFHYLDQNLSCE